MRSHKHLVNTIQGGEGMTPLLPDNFVQNDVVDTEYFILFKDDNTDSLNKRVRTLINNLASCGLVASQTSNEDLRMVLDNFLNGGKSFAERTVTTA